MGVIHSLGLTSWYVEYHSTVWVRQLQVLGKNFSNLLIHQLSVKFLDNLLDFSTLHAARYSIPLLNSTFSRFFLNFSIEDRLFDSNIDFFEIDGQKAPTYTGLGYGSSRLRKLSP